MESGEMNEKLKQIGKKIWVDIKSIKWPLLILVIYWIVTRIVFGEFCLMKILIGLPCPGCGATRAGFSMLTFQWAEALEMNPTVFIWAIFILFLLYQRYIGKKRPKISNILLVMICIIMISWYMVGMYFYFPTREPFTFYDGSILERCYPYLYEMLQIGQ